MMGEEAWEAASSTYPLPSLATEIIELSNFFSSINCENQPPKIGHQNMSFFPGCGAHIVSRDMPWYESPSVENRDDDTRPVHSYTCLILKKKPIRISIFDVTFRSIHSGLLRASKLSLERAQSNGRITTNPEICATNHFRLVCWSEMILLRHEASAKDSVACDIFHVCFILFDAEKKPKKFIDAKFRKREKSVGSMTAYAYSHCFVTNYGSI